MWFKGCGKRVGLFIPFEPNYFIQISQVDTDGKYLEILNLQKKKSTTNINILHSTILFLIQIYIYIFVWEV